MRIPIVAAAIAWLCLAPSQNTAQDDRLARQTAIVREGKTSIPVLLAGYRDEIRREPHNPLG